MPKKTIIFMRHAESPMIKGDDFERPLSAFGVSQAERVGEVLAQHGYVPDYVLCSSATRTCQTLNAAMSCMDGDNYKDEDVACSEKLYNSSVSEIFRHIQTCPEEAETVLVIAHNPGIWGAASAGWNRAESANSHKLLRGCPPATAFVLELCDETKSWQDFSDQSCSLREVIFAEDIMSA